MEVEVYKDKAGEWRWRKVAANGRIVAESGEGYTRHSDALEAAEKFADGEPVTGGEDETDRLRDAQQRRDERREEELRRRRDRIDE